jgi:omega-6 fatty acid desaturase (delta-12 desaturase)
LRQWIERPHRSFYTLLHLWLPRVFLASFRGSEVRRRSHGVDIAFTGLFVSWAMHSGHSPTPAILYGAVVPFLTWCALFGLTLYLQHTHPRARFFANRPEREFLTCCRTCRLYYYHRHCWLDFAGKVTAW